VESHSLGFEVIVVMAGHYPLLYHARAACELFNLDYARYGTPAAWACTGYELVRDEIPEAGDHAAAWETSLMMALRPELVDLSRLPKSPKAKLVGVGGRDPRQHASVEFGRRGVDAIVRRVGKKVNELLTEK
jgi:creatinine amidohydrolase/Fe(II)-dependent formamide hydrolase-like protein